MASRLRVWLLAGPPFSAAQYRATQARLHALRPELEVEAVAVSTLGSGWEEAAASLAARVAEGDVVYAHGLAVPVACGLAARTRLGGLLLGNGPLRRLDALTDTALRVAALPGAGALLFRESVWLWWLRSSVGLRRAVNNPYAMDRDTVATICGDLVASPAASVALRNWLLSLRQPWPDPASLPRPVALLWGDNDRLHPLSEADEIDAVRGGGCITVQAGGRFAWPEEMPWALADAVLSAVAKASEAGPVSVVEPSPKPLPAAVTTGKSRSGRGGAPRKTSPDGKR